MNIIKKVTQEELEELLDFVQKSLLWKEVNEDWAREILKKFNIEEEN